MHDGDRAEGIASLTTAIAGVLLFILVLSFVFSSLSGTKNYSDYQSHATKCADADKAYGKFLDAHITDAYPADYEKQNAKHKEKIAQWCDLAAQELTAEAGAKSANFTRIATFAAIAGLVLLFVTVTQASGMLAEAKRTTRITREIGQAQTRAYLSIKKIGWPERIAEKIEQFNNLRPESSPVLRAGDSFNFSFEVENSGETPAYDVFIYAKLNIKCDEATFTAESYRPEKIGFLGKKIPYLSSFVFKGVKSEQGRPVKYSEAWVYITAFIVYRDVFQGEDSRWSIEQIFMGKMLDGKFASISSAENLNNIKKIKENHYS